MAVMPLRQRGFSLVEVLVVLTIIVVISAVAIPGIWDAYDEASRIVDGAQGTGITGEYYSGSSQNGGIFNSMITTRTDEQISMLEDDRPTGVPVDHYSVRWVGMFRAEQEGSYNFYPRTDDGVDLFINGNLLVNDIDNTHGMQEFTASADLDAGQYVTLEMNFQEFSGGSGAEMRFSGPDINKQIIPALHLYPVGTQAQTSITQYENKLETAIDLSKHVRYHR